MRRITAISSSQASFINTDEVERLAERHLQDSGVTQNFGNRSRIQAKVDSLLRQVAEHLLNLLSNNVRLPKTAGMTAKEYINN